MTNTQLSESAIKDIVDGMPDGLDGFCTHWGWLQFARKIETAHRITAPPARPEIQVGQRLLVQPKESQYPYEILILEISGVYVKIKPDQEDRRCWTKLPIVQESLLRVLDEPTVSQKPIIV